MISNRHYLVNSVRVYGITKYNKVRRRGLLVASRKRTCLLEVETCELQAGQSKAHLFEVGPYSSSGGGVGGGSGGGRLSEGSPSTNGRDNNEESPGVPKVCNASTSKFSCFCYGRWGVVSRTFDEQKNPRIPLCLHAIFGLEYLWFTVIHAHRLPSRATCTLPTWALSCEKRAYVRRRK